MADSKPTNIKDVLEQAGYTLAKINDAWTQNKIKIPEKSTAELQIITVGNIWGKNRDAVTIAYHNVDIDQITAALDLSETLEKHQITHRADINCVIYHLVHKIPQDCSPVLELRRRADLAERIMRESKYYKKD